MTIRSLERSLMVTDITGADLIGRDVDLLAVDPEMAVVDELTGLGAGCGETGAPHDVVETLLQHPQEVLAGDAGATGGFLVIAAELLLEHAVHGAELLLLAKLDLVVALADAAPCRARPVDKGDARRRTASTGRAGYAPDGTPCTWVRCNGP